MPCTTVAACECTRAHRYWRELVRRRGGDSGHTLNINDPRVLPCGIVRTGERCGGAGLTRHIREGAHAPPFSRTARAHADQLKSSHGENLWNLSRVFSCASRRCARSGPTVSRQGRGGWGERERETGHRPAPGLLADSEHPKPAQHPSIHPSLRATAPAGGRERRHDVAAD